MKNLFTNLLNAFTSLNPNKPRITVDSWFTAYGEDGLWISEIDNPVQNARDFDVKVSSDIDNFTVLKWSKIKEINNHTRKQAIEDIKAILEKKDVILEDDDFRSNYLTRYYDLVDTYKTLANFYYDNKGTAFLTELEESLES